MNSYTNPKYSGLQVYYSKGNEGSFILANSIQTSVKESVDTKNERMIKEGKGMYVLENVTNPAVLIECGFLTNPEECEKLSKKEYRKQLSLAIVCGIIEYEKTLKW
jgi:N-acetylmuramoyl-L-alanine amidase